MSQIYTRIYHKFPKLSLFGVEKSTKYLGGKKMTGEMAKW
jgi:hypothetical protein